MRQSADIGAHAPYENAVFVGIAHRHAWREYADKQLSNLQKQICLIEFLHLGLVIGCQGATLGLPKIKNTRLGVENTHRFAHLRTFLE